MIAYGIYWPLFLALSVSPDGLLIAGMAVVLALGLLAKYAGDYLFKTPSELIARFDSLAKGVTDKVDKLSEKLETTNTFIQTELGKYRERLVVVEQASLRLPDVERKLDAIIMGGLANTMGAVVQQRSKRAVESETVDL